MQVHEFRGLKSPRIGSIFSNKKNFFILSMNGADFFGGSGASAVSLQRNGERGRLAEEMAVNRVGFENHHQWRAKAS